MSPMSEGVVITDKFRPLKTPEIYWHYMCLRVKNTTPSLLHVMISGPFTDTFNVKTKLFSVAPSKTFGSIVVLLIDGLTVDPFLLVHAIFDDKARSAEEVFVDQEAVGRAGIKRVPILIVENEPIVGPEMCRCGYVVEPPGDIATQPATRIVFNAPYDDKHTYHIKVTNVSELRIGWAFKTTNMKRLGVDPSVGVLDPNESSLIAVSCDAFAYGQEDINNDSITIEWTNTPGGVKKEFNREWFRRDGVIRRKNLPIEYNP